MSIAKADPPSSQEAKDVSKKRNMAEVSETASMHEEKKTPPKIIQN